jgi:triacylglycerol lipase
MKHLIELEKKPLPNYQTIAGLAPPYSEYSFFKNAEYYPFRYDLQRFSLLNAWWLAELSTLAYSSPTFIKPQLKAAELPTIYPFEGKKEGTNGFLAGNKHFIVLVFRGTEVLPRQGINFRNVIRDLATDAEFRLIKSPHGGRAHEGFQEALDEVWPLVVQQLTKLKNKYPNATIWFTGHSLGGALATLAADRYANIGKLQGVYIYGAPRVGDAEFRDSFNRRVNAYRIVYHSDIVTVLPPSDFGYKHVGAAKFITSTGEIIDHLGWWQELKALIFGELSQILTNLADLEISDNLVVDHVPQSIKDHIPTYYAVSLWNSYVDFAQQI